MNKVRHLAIIMDGNGRWAKSKGRTRSFGHKQGLKNLDKIIRVLIKNNIKYLTLYTFSYDNWKRPKKEITNIFILLENYLKKNFNDLKKKNINVSFIGENNKLPQSIRKLIKLYNNNKFNKSKLRINVAFNYSSKKEIMNAIRLLFREKKKINEVNFVKSLYTRNFPDPDLLIRTGGRKRLSDFLLWQISYTELYFIDKLWPEFNENDLVKVLKNFKLIKRNYGK
ncbi:MAG: di-trans,poly-cis-decaprenylcistransferase [Candidatus Pelagibacter sp.]|nr:di-trans,poly-cis-decaprenylcistransferase [Candidatus Pelagibacter sp.]OUV97549.1 MAG: di-trans,poly-cis-decaprenylcistransferase [Candidatus Pelagibacter sp. TMED142]